MKPLKIFFGLFSLFIFIACGPTQEEQEKQKKTEDSLMEIERNKALENADKLLQMDTTEVVNDSVAVQENK